MTSCLKNYKSSIIFNILIIINVKNVKRYVVDPTYVKNYVTTVIKVVYLKNKSLYCVEFIWIVKIIHILDVIFVKLIIARVI